ncbi:MAG: HAD-IIA family hydrolase [Candidatus Methanofastidiosa archaeon]|nr:HAD-IIA family hydrolase [Candidatus Methanofastidiosa archaeon]
MPVGYLIDIDGVVRVDDRPIPSGVRFVTNLLGDGVPFLFLTNNATKTVGDTARMLRSLGMPVEPRQVVTSGEVTASLLASRNPDARVMVIGERGLSDTCEAHGLVVSDAEPDYVVVGLDYHLTYDKLRRACLAIRAGASFVATNPDKTFPSVDGIIPGAGAITAALEACTGVAPRVIGKPHAEIFSHAVKLLGIPKRDVFVIGDRLDTDIAGAAAAGLHSILVTTGIASRTDAAAFEGPLDIIVSSLDELSWSNPHDRR